MISFGYSDAQCLRAIPLNALEAGWGRESQRPSSRISIMVALRG